MSNNWDLYVFLSYLYLHFVYESSWNGNFRPICIYKNLQDCMQHICSGCSFLRTCFIADYEVADPSHCNDHQYFTTRTWFIADYEVTDPSHSNNHQYFTTRTWFIADYEVTDPSHSNNHQYFTRHPCKVCPVQFEGHQAAMRRWFPSCGAKCSREK